VRWSFQTTHHDLWDYDVASQPTLVDIPSAAGVQPALLQPTKRGELFLLDRRNGHPLAAVQERPAPQDGIVPEERLSKTQPFSVGMPSVAGPPLTERDMWGLTPLDQLWCRIRFKEARYEGPLTPPGLTPSIEYPGYSGGADWGGASVDLDRMVLVVNSNRLANYNQLITRDEANARGLYRLTPERPSNVSIAAPQEGTPYGVLTPPFLSPLGVPCQRPPFGMLTAIDLNTRKVVWSHALGTARDSGPFGLSSMLPFTLGTPNAGGSLVTRGGVVFISAAQDRYLRAFDTRSGDELWKVRLPAGGQATPMSYYSDSSARQFVVIAAGGHAGLQTKAGDYIMAFALPRDRH
jgi:quinoprotein glucose dehydrogenase